MGEAVTLLTVCIPTVPARRSLLSRLLFTLGRQSALEVLVADGLRPMGDKVNEMFAAAASPFVVVVDDDDMVDGAYMALLAPHLRREVDFVGHLIAWCEDGRLMGLVSHSLQGDPSWGSLNRAVSPKCPTSTRIARRHLFGNHYTADREWSQLVFADCERGSFVPAPLYTYDHWNDHMLGTEPGDERAERPQRDVGAWPFDESRVTWM